MRHVACMGEKRNAYRVLVGNMKERYHFEDLELNGRVLLKLKLKT